MSAFTQLHYDVANQIVKIGASLRWQDVHNALDPFRVSMVGGRVLEVGVGELTLGGTSA